VPLQDSHAPTAGRIDPADCSAWNSESLHIALYPATHPCGSVGDHRLGRDLPRRATQGLVTRSRGMESSNLAGASQS
jgi:hypothetical protein